MDLPKHAVELVQNTYYIQGGSEKNARSLMHHHFAAESHRVHQNTHQKSLSTNQLNVKFVSMY